MKTSQVFLSSLLILATGCSAKITGGGAPAPTAAPVTTQATTVLEGKWASGCVLDHGLYMSETAQFSGNNLTTSASAYNDAACSTTALYSDNEQGTFTIGAASTVVSGATNIDIAFNKGPGVTQDIPQIFEIVGGNILMGDTSSATGRPTALDQVLVLKPAGTAVVVPTPTPPPVPPSTPTVLEGKWATGCVYDQGFYMTISAQYTGNTVSTVANVYGDSACASAALSKDNENGTFVIGAASTVVSGATNIDLTLTNGQGVTSTTYSIFEVTGGNLFMGTTSGQTPDTRPTALDQVLVLKPVQSSIAK